MPGKEFLFRDHAHIAMLRGISLLAQAVKTTLGPKGRHVMLDRPKQSPMITKDGVTVAKEITLSDPFKNMGALIARDAARRTADRTGEGTTTAIVLTEALVREGVRYLAAGASASDLKRGIDRAVERVLGELTRMSQPCRTTQTLRHVAALAAPQDPVLGDLVADAVLRVGREGIVVVEESGGPTTWVDVQKGLRIDGGYLSPSFVTDAETMTVVLERPALLILDQKLTVLRALFPLLEELAAQHVPLLVVATEVSGDALALLALNRVRGVLQVAAVKAPGVGALRTALLDDLAIVTGGQACMADTGKTLTSVTAADVGRASRVVIDREHTTVLGGQGDPGMIQARIAQIKAQMARSASDEERQELQRRVAHLAGGVAVIHVGATTDTEVQEKKARVAEAVQATQATMEEGFLPGGGVALFRCAPVLDALVVPPEQQLGVAIVRQALEAPLRQIAENAGHAGSVVVSKIPQQGPMIGFDVITETFVEMFTAGIIDPTNVTRIAVAHAASVAGVLLTTGVMVTELRDEQRTEQGSGAQSV